MLNKLLEVLAEFDAATIEEQRAALQPVARIHKRISIRVMTEIEQKTALVFAITSGNKVELEALRDHSQFPNVADWAKEELLPRGPMSRFAL